MSILLHTGRCDYCQQFMQWQYQHCVNCHCCPNKGCSDNISWCPLIKVCITCLAVVFNLFICECTIFDALLPCKLVHCLSNMAIFLGLIYLWPHECNFLKGISVVFITNHGQAFAMYILHSWSIFQIEDTMPLASLY